MGIVIFCNYNGTISRLEKWGKEKNYDVITLNENEENVVIPHILIPKSRRNGNNPMDIDEDDENEENYRLVSQSDVLDKYLIIADERVSALNGQYGVRAKRDLAAHTVVGQYCGVEYLESEFHNAFIGTRENVEKNI